MSYRTEKTIAGQDIVISGWENGISDNPYTGIADMRNVDNVTITGEVSVALSTDAMITQSPITNAVFTVDSAPSGTVAISSTSNSGWATATAHTAAKPAGLAVGDVIFAQVYGVAGLGGITPPSGWTSLGFSTVNSGDGASFYYAKVASSSDVAASNFTFTFDSSSKGFVGLLRITNADTAFGNWVYCGDDKFTNNTATPSIAATITPGSASTLLIQLWAGATSVGSIGSYAIANDNIAWTETYDVADGTDRCVSVASGVRPQTTATGNVSAAGGGATTDWALGFFSIPQGGATTIITYSGTPALEVNTAITVSNSGGSLPSGFSINTAYYIKEIFSPTTFSVSAISAGGDALIFSTSGSGTNTFSTIGMGTPNYFASGKVVSPELGSYLSLYFLVDSNGRCWVYNTSSLGGNNKWVYMHNKTSEAASEEGNGLVVYKGYLFWFSSTEINVINMADLFLGIPTLAYLTTRASWVDGWKTDLSNESLSDISHQAILAVNDDSVYFCNAQHVGSIITAISIIGTPPEREDGEIFNIATTHTNATGITTNNSDEISTVSAFFTETDVGAVIVATGIPDGTYITSVTSGTTATISADATASNTGLDFTITSGYVYNAEALTIPSNDITTCLAELGINLLVGGVNNYIYPWDRVSTGYNPAIFCSESYISRMVTINTTTYIFCGYKGRIYQTNGSNVSDFWEVPEYLSNTTNPYFMWTDAIFNRNQLYFGLKCFENDGTTINQYGALWTVDVNTGAGKLQNKLSYDTYAGYVSALWVNRGLTPTERPSDDGYGLFIGWNNGTLGGIDISVSDPYTGTQAIIVSDMIPVGLYLTKWTGNNLEFKLGAPLVAGESVTLAYRQNIADAFVDVPITEGGGVGEISGITSMNFEKVQWLQIQATLISTVTNPSFVRLRELRVR